MKYALVALLLGTGYSTPSHSDSRPPDPVDMDTARLITSLEAIKRNPRGPFQRIRWFCQDGSILPPRPYACSGHGGGVQHGEWSPEARDLRQAGFPIATTYADLTSDNLIGAQAPRDRIPLLLLEQFLIHSDDGWVLRQARFYRGAFQAEDEARSARRILLDLADSATWRSDDFLLLREMVRLLPHNQDSPILTEVRGMAARLARRDPAFTDLRNKIHVRPEASDAERVRDYLEALQQRATVSVDLLSAFQSLRERIELAYRPLDLGSALQTLAGQVDSPALKQSLLESSQALQTQPDPGTQLALCAHLLATLREHLSAEPKATAVLAALDLSLLLERHSFTAASAMLGGLESASRAQRLRWLQDSAKALYGSGFLTAREWLSLEDSFQRLDQQQLALAEYRQMLHHLERVPGWVQRRLNHYFGPAVEHLSRIEPLAEQFIPDRLRASPLLFFAEIADTLVQDAQQLSQVQHLVFGKPVASGLRKLNAGLARGILSTAEELRHLPPSALRNRLYVTTATTTDLPPVAGILTAAEGNELSHVQMLARNLGIPNVVVSPDLLQEILLFRGVAAVLAASPGGIVRLEPDTPGWAPFFDNQQQTAPRSRLRLNSEKLDLHPALIPLHQLRAEDSGRRTGPKAAQLGELSRHFPGRVSPGLVVPFGVFHAMLQRPIEVDGPPAADWLVSQYARFEQLQSGSAQEREAAHRHLNTFLARIRDWLQQQTFDPQFKESLRQQMQEQFGPPGTYGVFVRSDTNVEDLPEFSGAGLNLTIPHVVEFDRVLAGIKAVWASAFSERAFAWRQLRVAEPQWVQVSVLLHQSVPVSKSGVLVTADLETGAPGTLSVATNEGVGGGVEGQAAESLRIDLASGSVRLLASSTASRQRELLTDGGSRLIPAQAPEQLLTEAEIAQLIDLANQLPADYPGLRDEQGQRLAADIEFGFLDGELQLFQLRPFLHTPFASRSQFLSSLDRPLNRNAAQPILLAEAPRQPLVSPNPPDRSDQPQ